MPYTKQSWSDTSAGGTPVSAARLNYIEDGIEAAHADADAAETASGAAVSTAGAASTLANNALAAANAAQATANNAVLAGDFAAKGDLITATAAGTKATKTVGTDGRMLTADTADATGLAWGRKIVTAGTPPTGQINDIWVDSATPAIWEHDGTDWVEIANLGGNAPTDLIQLTTINAKGDLVVGTNNDAVSRLGVGADGRMLEADAGEATGMKWGRLITAQDTEPAGATTGDVWLQTNYVEPAPATPPGLLTQSIAHASAGALTVDLALGHTAQTTMTANITSHSFTGVADGDVLAVYYQASGASRDIDFSAMTTAAEYTNPNTITVSQNGIYRATFLRIFGTTYLVDTEWVA